MSGVLQSMLSKVLREVDTLLRSARTCSRCCCTGDVVRHVMRQLAYDQ